MAINKMEQQLIEAICVSPDDAKQPFEEFLATSYAQGLSPIRLRNLFKRIDMKGRCCALEVMVCNPAIANLIRENKTFQIPSIIQVGKKYGMQTLNDALYALYMEREVSVDECLRVSGDPNEFMRMAGLNAEGEPVNPPTGRPNTAPMSGKR